jgi:hypothetical protein
MIPGLGFGHDDLMKYWFDQHMRRHLISDLTHRQDLDNPGAQHYCNGPKPSLGLVPKFGISSYYFVTDKPKQKYNISSLIALSKAKRLSLNLALLVGLNDLPSHKSVDV